MKIERELYIKTILYSLFGYTGTYPYSFTYKQLNTMSKTLFKTPIYKQKMEQNKIDYLLSEAKKLNFGYAEHFLRKWKIQNSELDLPMPIKRRIINLELSKQKYIFEVISSYDEITDESVNIIFNNENIDFYTASIIIDMYIDDFCSINNIVQIFDEIDMKDQDLIKDYICDYISDFSRRDVISDWSLNPELNNEIILLDTFDFFMVLLNLNKSHEEINKANLDETVKRILVDILLENSERPFKRLKIKN